MQQSVRDRKRDLKILHMRNNLKWTYTKIAAHFDISKARARQLYMRMNGERNKGSRKGYERKEFVVELNGEYVNNN